MLENWSVISAVSEGNIELGVSFHKKLVSTTESNLPSVCGIETGPNDKLRRPLWDDSYGARNSLVSFVNVLKKI